MNKITADHLARRAIVYVRQSSERQVRHNTGSQDWQYGLEARARSLGWKTVTFVDQDLGLSGAGVVRRSGFNTMLDAVCNREVGIILSVEASRLSRNGREWHTLIEFCGIVGCLLADEQAVYEPRLPTDRMILGLHGTMSELELANMRRRSIEGRNHKAARGELFLAVSAGYQRVGKNAIEKDADLRVRAAIELVFCKFDEMQSIRQVHLWFRDEGLELPSRPKTEKQQLRWQVPNYARVREILTNPVYCGAYAYGRTATEVEIRDGQKKVRRKVVSNRDDWQVFIPDNHEGYISLETWERNQRVIADNRTKMMLSGSRGAVRSGAALLAGLLRCGHCGLGMSVSYSGGSGNVLRYVCKGAFPSTGKTCISFGGLSADEAVGREMVRILEPIGLEAALRAIEDDTGAGSEAVRQHEIVLERARYEADRAFRQYDAVDPGNRQVAGELERRWNERLVAVQTAEDALKEAREAWADMRMDEAEREACLQLGADLELAWNHEGVSAEIRKRILRAALEEIVVWREERRTRLLLHWRGGDHTELFVAQRARGQHRHVTDVETGALITGLARQMPDMAIAALLNRLGQRTGKGNSWKKANVCSFRNKRGIPPYCEGERQERGEMTLSEVAAALKVDYQKVLRLVRQRRLPARQFCPGALWIVSAADVDRIRAGEPPEPPSLALFEDHDAATGRPR